MPCAISRKSENRFLDFMVDLNERNVMEQQKAPRLAYCQYCGRRIAVNGVAKDAQGQEILVWHYTQRRASANDPAVECFGSNRAVT